MTIFIGFIIGWLFIECIVKLLHVAGHHPRHRDSVDSGVDTLEFLVMLFILIWACVVFFGDFK